MTQLPAAIEQYLMECGFTSTEILILKHVLAGGAMTLRELAAKTGKSTGVLDSASKKLLKKGILGKEIVNESPKLTLSSLEALVAWVHEDSEEKRKFMERREKDLQSFVDSLSTQVNRADIIHYEDLDGLEGIYTKLLEVCNGSMLHFLPVRYTEVEDPLRDFFVQFFRIRRRRGIITRVIAHNTPLGRRYQSRDPFEYRQTLLVPESVYAFNTEKVVAGDWVGTINRVDKKAFIIRSPEMAHTERAMFEAIWTQEMAKQKEKGSSVPVVVPKEEEMKTKMVSAVREFFLSRRSLLGFLLFGIAAALIVLSFYKYMYYINTQRLRERATGIAATASLQFDATYLDKLHTYKDVSRPEYSHTVALLQKIRTQNSGIKYAYILRPTSNEYYWEFVADADSQILSPQRDINGDGILSDQVPPGYLWLDESPSTSSIRKALRYPFADEIPVTDPWGTWISGHAPIKNTDGNTVAVLGIDWHVQDVEKLTHKMVMPFSIFFAIFLFFISLQFAAKNRPLLKEVFALYKPKRLLFLIGFVGSVSLLISVGSYFHTINIIKEQTAQRLRAIAATTALQIDNKDLSALHFAKDMKKNEYQKVYTILNNVRRENHDIKWAFVLRPTSTDNIWEFVVDADANYFIPERVDENNDGILSESEENVFPGFQYDVSNDPKIILALDQSIAVDEYHSDQWGSYLSGYAPIFSDENKATAVIGLDIKIDDFTKQVRSKYLGVFMFIGIATFFLLLLPAYIKTLKTSE